MKARSIKIEFDEKDDWWQVQCSDGIELEEAVRMVRKAWADHERPKEPLLTREASRIFRDWAEMHMVDEVRCRYINDKIITFVDEEGTYVGGAKIDISVNHASRKIVKGEVYTIAELCGEEE